MNIGDKILFGEYKWVVLEVHCDKALIITDEIVEQRDYHDKNTDITWKDCEIRKYLNGDFYNRFSADEKSRIIKTVNKNPNNNWYHSLGGEDTVDNIFLLSLDEAVRKYFGDSGKLLDNPLKNQRYWFQRKDENNIKRIAKLGSCVWWWWLRSPGKNNRYAVYVHGDGNVGIQGNGISKRDVKIIHPQTNDNRGGVRPALWLKR
jgi:hypothetical protein